MWSSSSGLTGSKCGPEPLCMGSIVDACAGEVEAPMDEVGSCKEEV